MYLTPHTDSAHQTVGNQNPNRWTDLGYLDSVSRRPLGGERNGGLGTYWDSVEILKNGALNKDKSENPEIQLLDLGGKKTYLKVHQWEGNKILHEFLNTQNDLEKSELKDIIKKTNKSLNSCGHAIVENPLISRKEINGDSKRKADHSVLGSLHCASQACPICQQHQAVLNFIGIKDGLDRFEFLAKKLGKKLVVLTATLTVPHAKGVGIDKVKCLLKDSWRFMLCFYGKKLQELLNYDGYVRILEITHDIDNETGHPHYHITFFCFRDEKIESKEEIDDFNIELSTKIWELFDTCVRKIVEKSRSVLTKVKKKNKKIVSKTGKKTKTEKNYTYDWIDLDKKNIVTKPYFEARKEVVNNCKKQDLSIPIKGGVVVEICKNTQAFAKYLAKEMAYGNQKRAKKVGNKTMNELLEISLKGRNKNATKDEVIQAKQARKAYVNHVASVYNEKRIEWSRSKEIDGKKVNYYDYLVHMTQDFIKEKEENKITIVAETDKYVYNVEIKTEYKNGFELAKMFDRADIDPSKIDFEKEGNGLFRNIKQDETSQQLAKEELARQFKESIIRMQEKRKKNLEKKKLFKQLEDQRNLFEWSFKNE